MCLFFTWLICHSAECELNTKTDGWNVALSPLDVTGSPRKRDDGEKVPFTDFLRRLLLCCYTFGARGHKQSSHFPTDPKSSAVHFPWLSLGAWTWISTADHRKLSRPRWIYSFYRGSLLETLCSTKLCVIHLIWFCCAFGDAVGAVNEGEVASGRKSRRDVGKPSGHDKSLMTRHYIEISVWKQLLLSSLCATKDIRDALYDMNIKSIHTMLSLWNNPCVYPQWITNYYSSHN